MGKRKSDGKAVDLGVNLAQPPTLLALNRVSGVALQPSRAGCLLWLFWMVLLVQYKSEPWPGLLLNSVGTLDVTRSRANSVSKHYVFWSSCYAQVREHRHTLWLCLSPPVRTVKNVPKDTALHVRGFCLVPKEPQLARAGSHWRLCFHLNRSNNRQQSN